MAVVFANMQMVINMMDIGNKIENRVKESCFINREKEFMAIGFGEKDMAQVQYILQMVKFYSVSSNLILYKEKL